MTHLYSELTADVFH